MKLEVFGIYETILDKKIKIVFECTYIIIWSNNTELYITYDI